MWGVLIAFALVGGLVKLSFREATEPVIKPAVEKLRLAKLAKMPPSLLTLDQAEDGMVLSRRLGEKELERRFAAVVKGLKSHRGKR